MWLRVFVRLWFEHDPCQDTVVPTARSAESPTMPLLPLTDVSRPFGDDMAVLRGILMDARRCHARDGVTGR